MTNSQKHENPKTLNLGFSKCENCQKWQIHALKSDFFVPRSAVTVFGVVSRVVYGDDFGDGFLVNLSCYSVVFYEMPLYG